MEDRVKKVFESKSDDSFVVPESHYQEVDKIREAHMLGKGESYTWDEVKERLTAKHGL